MANQMYTKGLQSFLEGGIAWLTDNIKVVLVDSAAYTPAVTTHQFLSDIPSGARIATSANLAGKTSTGGVAGANNAVFTAASGVQSEYAVIYKDTGTAATSSLIYFMDTMTGLPVTPNGGDITLAWDTGPNKIFKLTP
jgi:hypothetical protein